MDSKTIERLNQYSEKYLGARSKWRKLVEKGMVVPATEIVKETNTNEETGEDEVFEYRKHSEHNGIPLNRLIRATPESLLALFEAQEEKDLKEEQERAKQEEINNALMAATGTTEG
jgi:hypothetical protein